jgi:hypothetical protein
MIRLRGMVREVAFSTVLMPCPCQRGELRWDDNRAWRCDAMQSCGYAVPISGLFGEQDLEYKLSLGFHPRNLEPSVFFIEHLYAGLIWLDWLTRIEIERMHAGIPDRKARDEDRVLYAWFMRLTPRAPIPEWVLPEPEGAR